MSDVTRILSAIEQGDQKASEQLLPLMYEELRMHIAHRMAGERPTIRYEQRHWYMKPTFGWMTSSNRTSFELCY